MSFSWYIYKMLRCLSRFIACAFVRTVMFLLPTFVNGKAYWYVLCGSDYDNCVIDVLAFFLRIMYPHKKQQNLKWPILKKGGKRKVIKITILLNELRMFYTTLVRCISMNINFEIIIWKKVDYCCDTYPLLKMKFSVFMKHDENNDIRTATR